MPTGAEYDAEPMEASRPSSDPVEKILREEKEDVPPAEKDAPEPSAETSESGPPEGDTPPQEPEEPVESTGEPPPARMWAGRYRSPEDLERAYTEAQQALSRQGQEVGMLRRQQAEARERALLELPPERMSEDQFAALQQQADALGMGIDQYQAHRRLVQAEMAPMRQEMENRILLSEVTAYAHAHPAYATDWPAAYRRLTEDPEVQYLFPQDPGMRVEERSRRWQRGIDLLLKEARAERLDTEFRKLSAAQEKARKGSAAASQEARRKASGEASRSAGSAPPHPAGEPDRKKDVLDEILAPRRRGIRVH